MSQQVQLAEIQQLSWWKRLYRNLLRVFAPLL